MVGSGGGGEGGCWGFRGWEVGGHVLLNIDYLHHLDSCYCPFGQGSTFQILNSGLQLTNTPKPMSAV